MAMKNRVATFLSKTRSSKGSVKQPSIDELRTEKEDLEAKLDKLHEECGLYQKNAEDARTARREAEEAAQKAKEALAKAEEEKQAAVEEKIHAIEKMEEAQRIAAEHEEETKKQTEAAELSAAAAREAAEREKRASEAQVAAERLAEEQQAKLEKTEQSRISTEQEMGAKLTQALHARDAAEAERDAAFEDAQRARAACEAADVSAWEARQAQDVANERCREMELVADTKTREAYTATLQKEDALALLADMEQDKVDAENSASLERTAREKAELAMRFAESLSTELAEQVRNLGEEKDGLVASMREMELSLSRAQDELVQAQIRLSESIDAKENAELGLRESERRVEELTVLVQEWRERAEDARSMKEEFERALEKSRDAQYDAQRQAEEHRKAKEKAEAEKRGAERYSQKQEAQAKKDREAVLAAVADKEEAERNARNALDAFDEAQRKWKQGVQPTASPSESQIDALKKSRGFREGAFHVGVAGLTGTGKSSLINALMGVVTGTPEAVPTGNQYTQTVGRYIDARRNYPHIWYDVPGAGTLTAPSWNYFHDQGLFVFDAIMVVWDNRFTDVDIAVLENCVRLKIPAFIIRTKSDVHISNIEERMRDVVEADPTLTNKDRKSRYTVIPFSARAEYISETRSGVERSLHNANLPPMKVYLVSNKTITKIVQGDKNMRNVRVIDEFDLLNDIWALRRATSRAATSIPRMHNMRANTTPLI
ncbi:hypothetical protein F5878DRAFT_322740 [Lentinula raphanica]|uniref:IRG-type G domain-containing protein n=1 Tax=Lentinula raphanica TaxID=153919 RepID=A0AA38UA71_9AGAR|nr:hypothetical protein F5878DRAFT_322740 [Lentinula raphanica]